MKEQSDKIDKLLREKLYDFEPKDQAPSWDSFQQRQSSSKGAKIRLSKWAAIAGGVAAAAAAVMIMLPLSGDPQPGVNSHPTVVVVADTAKQTGIDTLKTNQKPALPQDQNQEIRPEIHTGKLPQNDIKIARGTEKIRTIEKPKSDTEDNCETTRIVIDDHDSNINDIRIAHNDNPNGVDDSDNNDDSGNDGNSGNDNNTDRTANVDQGNNDSSPKDHEYYSKYYGYDGEAQKKTNLIAVSAFYDTQAGQSVVNNMPVRPAAPIEPPLISFVIGNRSRDVEFVDWAYSMPITYGGTVSFGIPGVDRLRVESGLQFTNLKSHSEVLQGDRFVCNRTVNYIGIPLSATYRIVGNSKLEFYGSLGATADMAVTAKETISIVDSETPPRTNDLTAKGIQTSVHGALGLTYNFIPKLGIYIEPGMSHYFANPNQPNTIRTEKTFMFNLRAGFKFRL